MHIQEPAARQTKAVGRVGETKFADRAYGAQAHLCRCSRVCHGRAHVLGRHALRLEELRKYEGRRDLHLAGLYPEQGHARARGWGCGGGADLMPVDVATGREVDIDASSRRKFFFGDGCLFFQVECLLDLLRLSLEERWLCCCHCLGR